jgi:hypothetical protein
MRSKPAEALHTFSHAHEPNPPAPSTSAVNRRAVWFGPSGSELECLQKLVRRTGFGHERVRAGGQSIVAAVNREAVDHDAYARPAALDHGRRRDAIEAGHTNVKDHQVRHESFDSLNGRLTVRGFADHLETRVR